MNLIAFVLAGSCSIVVAAGIAIFRYRKIHRSFYPFLIIMVAGLVNECASAVMIHLLNRSNALTSNILSLVEGMLWVWQFRLWSHSPKPKRPYIILSIVLPGMWITENIFFNRIYEFSSVYAMSYSLILIFCAISHLNTLIVTEKRCLLKNSAFLISAGVVIFYTYRILVEAFYLFEMEESEKFLANVFVILASVNLFVNLLFALATLWIPTRQRFSMPFSWQAV